MSTLEELIILVNEYVVQTISNVKQSNVISINGIEQMNIDGSVLENDMSSFVDRSTFDLDKITNDNKLSTVDIRLSSLESLPLGNMLALTDTMTNLYDMYSNKLMFSSTADEMIGNLTVTGNVHALDDAVITGEIKALHGQCLNVNDSIIDIQDDDGGIMIGNNLLSFSLVENALVMEHDLFINSTTPSQNITVNGSQIFSRYDNLFTESLREIYGSVSNGVQILLNATLDGETIVSSNNLYGFIDYQSYINIPIYQSSVISNNSIILSHIDKYNLDTSIVGNLIQNTPNIFTPPVLPNSSQANNTLNLINDAYTLSYAQYSSVQNDIDFLDSIDVIQYNISFELTQNISTLNDDINVINSLIPHVRNTQNDLDVINTSLFSYDFTYNTTQINIDLTAFESLMNIELTDAAYVSSLSTLNAYNACIQDLSLLNSSLDEYMTINSTNYLNASLIVHNLTLDGGLSSFNVNINSTILDKHIILNNVPSYTDLNADKSGLIVRGDVDHTLVYDNALDSFKSSIPVKATDYVISYNGGHFESSNISIEQLINHSISNESFTLINALSDTHLLNNYSIDIQNFLTTIDSTYQSLDINDIWTIDKPQPLVIQTNLTGPTQVFDDITSFTSNINDIQRIFTDRDQSLNDLIVTGNTLVKSNTLVTFETYDTLPIIKPGHIMTYNEELYIGSLVEWKKITCPIITHVTESSPGLIDWNEYNKITQLLDDVVALDTDVQYIESNISKIDVNTLSNLLVDSDTIHSSLTLQLVDPSDLDTQLDLINSTHLLTTYSTSINDFVNSANTSYTLDLLNLSHERVNTFFNHISSINMDYQGISGDISGHINAVNNNDSFLTNINTSLSSTIDYLTSINELVTITHGQIDNGNTSLTQYSTDVQSISSTNTYINTLVSSLHLITPPEYSTLNTSYVSTLDFANVINDIVLGSTQDYSNNLDTLHTSLSTIDWSLETSKLSDLDISNQSSSTTHIYIDNVNQTLSTQLLKDELQDQVVLGNIVIENLVCGDIYDSIFTQDLNVKDKSINCSGFNIGSKSLNSSGTNVNIEAPDFYFNATPLSSLIIDNEQISNTNGISVNLALQVMNTHEISYNHNTYVTDLIALNDTLSSTISSIDTFIIPLQSLHDVTITTLDTLNGDFINISSLDNSNTLMVELNDDLTLLNSTMAGNTIDTTSHINLTSLDATSIVDVNGYKVSTSYLTQPSHTASHIGSLAIVTDDVYIGATTGWQQVNGGGGGSFITESKSLNDTGTLLTSSTKPDLILNQRQGTLIADSSRVYMTTNDSYMPMGHIDNGATLPVFVKDDHMGVMYYRDDNTVHIGTGFRWKQIVGI